MPSQAPANVLLIRDPRHHHDPRGGDVLAEIIRGAGMNVTLTEDVSAVSHLAGGDFDCCMLYTQGDTFTPAQVESLTQWVRGGGALVGIHTATATNKTDDHYARLIGSRFIGHGPVFDFDVTVSDPTHPMAHRVQNYHVTDELYLLKPFDDFRVFLTAYYNGKPQPLGYTKSEGKGRVVYLANGHDPRSLTHSTVKQLVVRAVRWARGEDWSDKTVKVAAIGYGGAFNMGKLHMESAQRAGLTPVAVCDVDPKRAATAKTEIGDHILTSHRIEDLLCNSDAELVVIITPHNTHAPLAIQCLQSGRHVITEKPFTITVDEATAVIDTAREHKKVATVFHNRRWDGDFLAIQQIIASGAVGQVFHVECAFSKYEPPKVDWWRAYKEVSGSALHDWGAHFVDWMLQLLPHRIESVSGDFKKFKWPQASIEDFAAAYVRFEGGRSASVEAGNACAVGKSRWRILGSLGGIEQKGWDMKDGLRVVSYRDGFRSDSIVPIGASDWDGFYRNVADHLLLGEALAVTPESARKVIAVIDLAERSSKQGGLPMKLPFES